MTTLEAKLGYTFHDPALLRTALTHSSYANENRAMHLSCNERLEFLGDAVLGLTAAEWLYRTFPQLPEGRMTRMRAELVCEQSLAKVAAVLGLGDELQLGRGEQLSGGSARPSILADAVEAIIAAVYLDGGDAAGLIDRLILQPMAPTLTSAATDYKTALQELVQRRPNSSIRYVPAGESGPDQNKSFTVQVFVNGEFAGTGTGRSKKEAEQAAAHQAYEAMNR